MKIFKIFLVLFCVIGFTPKILANDSLVLECFSLPVITSLDIMVLREVNFTI